MNRSTFSQFVALGFLLSLSLASGGCTGSRFSFDATGSGVDTRVAGGTVTGNPKLAAISVVVAGNANQAITRLIACPTALRLIPNKGSTTAVSLTPREVDVSTDSVVLGTLTVPGQEYDRIELDLSARCPSQRSLGLANTAGTFSSNSGITLAFQGVFNATPSATVKLEIQPIADHLSSVTADSQVKGSAESVPGSISQPSAASAVKHIFLSSALFTGNLGGLAGADTKCNSLAEAAGFSSSGWKAWLSDSNTDGVARLTDLGPWYLADGSAVVFPNKTAITTAFPAVPLTLTEQKTLTASPYAWTGTQANGQKFPGLMCNDWTSNSAIDAGLGGTTDQTNSNWTDGWNTTCNAPLSLYCFEQ